MKASTGCGGSTASYREFLDSRRQYGSLAGFDPIWMPDFLFDFQRVLASWAINLGRAAIFADCGLGKTPLQLVWAENVVRHTNKPVLILTPIAVGRQTLQEADKFGVEAAGSQDGKFPRPARIVVTNYERLHYFNPDDFSGVVCDESSILKNFKGTRRAEITEFMRSRPYRLLCTATAAPNDFMELGTSSEALGHLGFQDMIARFFVQVTSKDHLGWGRTKYRVRGHAERDFWRWVVSWARSCRKPSDLGGDDRNFHLPQLITNEHTVKSRTLKKGMLFSLPAEGLQDQREERRRTIGERCEKAAELVDHDHPAVSWCHLNDEGDMLEQLIPDSVQVSGRDTDDRKEDILSAFAAGDIRVLVTKPTIAGYGLNWQHCSHETFFPSHSFEQWYQAVRRCYRFGQKRQVVVDVISSEGERGVLGNMNEKAARASEMFDRLNELMGDQLNIEREIEFTNKEEIPSWL